MQSARQLAATSPSIALERGVGRLRPPVRRRHEPSPSPSPPSRREKRPIPPPSPHSFRETRPKHAFLLLTALATVATFIVLTFFLARSWRWEPSRILLSTFSKSLNPQHRISEHSSLKTSSKQSSLTPTVNRITTPSQPVPHYPFHEEKYLAWLPHSGFHNQRVAFENALILARALNRTLIIPPVRLGHPFGYGTFDKLHRFVALSTKVGLEHCPRAMALASFIPPECLGYDEFTMLPWSALVDLHAVSHIVPVVERWDSSSAWLKLYLNVSRKETAYVRDTRPYQYQYYDSRANLHTLNPRYRERLDFEDLERYKKYRLIHFGSLFGTARLRLKMPPNLETRREVRERMVFANHILVDIAREISDALGGPHFFGMHMRMGDGSFAVERDANLRLLWWSLVTGPMGVPMSEAHEIEARVMGWPDSEFSEWPAPPPHLIATEMVAELDDDQLYQNPNGTTRDETMPTCRFAFPPAHSSLGVPVFIATDAQSPRTSHALQLFLRTLPCVYFLSDFPVQTSPLDSVTNEDDGLRLEPFLLPFVDSMVAAMGKAVVGTPHSTFSRFTIDVLHRMYHGLPIVERGR